MVTHTYNEILNNMWNVTGWEHVKTLTNINGNNNELHSAIILRIDLEDWKRLLYTHELNCSRVILLFFTDELFTLILHSVLFLCWLFTSGNYYRIILVLRTELKPYSKRLVNTAWGYLCLKVLTGPLNNAT